MNLSNVKKLLRSKVGNVGRDTMYDMVIAQYVAIIASNMRITVSHAGAEPTPCNLYSLIIAPSGVGKNFTIDLVEKTLLDPFYELFRPIEIAITEDKMHNFIKHNEDVDNIESIAYKKFYGFGALPILVDSATPAGLKAFRQQAQLLGIGALGLSIDEIGSSLTKLEEVLSEMLTLHGSGLLKGKLIRGSVDSQRIEDDGSAVPANLIMFGTDNIMFDGGSNEHKVKSWLESGYARRLFFTYIEEAPEVEATDALEIYKQRLNGISLEDARVNLDGIITRDNIGKNIEMDEDTNIAFIEFEIKQKELASTLDERDFIRKIEISHSPQKVLKLAGAYAFIRGLDYVSMECLDKAISVCEASSEAFRAIMSTKPAYVRLCSFLAKRREPVPQFEVKEQPYMPEAKAKFNEIFELATSFGYEHGIIVSQYNQGSVTYYKAEELRESKEDSWIISHSRKLAEGYVGKRLSVEMLKKLLVSGANWCNTHFHDEYRLEENVTGASNLLVLDIDKGSTIDQARAFLEGFKYIIATTKSHTESHHRFRVILFLSHEVIFTGDEYKRFSSNVCRWLPFNDSATTQRSRKWATYKDSIIIENEGKLLPTMDLIPRSVINTEREETIIKLGNISNLERWFILTGMDNGRNNTLFKYAKVLEEAGEENKIIIQKVRNLNKGFKDPLSSEELDKTVLTHFKNI